jgi:hypothetical protein
MGGESRFDQGTGERFAAFGAQTVACLTPLRLVHTFTAPVRTVAGLRRSIGGGV